MTGLRFATSIGGKPCAFPLGTGHLLIAGRTGAGKSTVLRALLWSAASSPDCSILGIDLKQVELIAWGPRLEHLATTRSAAVNLLATIEQVVTARFAAMRDLGVVQWDPAFGPWLLLVIDELAELLSGPKSVKAEVEDAEARLDSIARLGRAAGVHLICATQRPSVEVLGGSLRDQLAYRFGLAVSDKGTSGLVTQGAAVDLTTVADLGAGWGYWIAPGGPPVLARGDWHPDRAVAAHAAATARPKETSS